MDDEKLYNPQAPVPTYAQDGDGNFYQRIPRADGDYDYVPAQPGLQFHELADGSFIGLRDADEAARQREFKSHEHYFEQLAAKDGKTIRQNFKRLDKLQQQMERLAIDRVMPGSAPNVRQVKDNEFMALREQYSQAVVEGRQRDCEFQPLNSYANKLITRTGKILRPILQGEVGMIGDTILTLEPGYGTGNFSKGGL